MRRGTTALEQRGLVMRVPGADRRVKLLALTEGGKAERVRVTTVVAEQSMVLRRLDDGQRAVLAPLLERLLGPKAAETSGGVAETGDAVDQFGR